MIYVDTNVAVAYVNTQDPLHERASGLLERLKDRGLVVSELVVTELYSVYSRVMDVSDVEVEALVEYTLVRLGARREGEIDFQELMREAQLHAPRLRLRTLDLLHVVAARLLGAEGIATLDRDIVEKREELRRTLGIEVYTGL